MIHNINFPTVKRKLKHELICKTADVCFSLVFCCRFNIIHLHWNLRIDRIITVSSTVSVPRRQNAHCAGFAGKSSKGSVESWIWRYCTATFGQPQKFAANISFLLWWQWVKTFSEQLKITITTIDNWNHLRTSVFFWLFIFVTFSALTFFFSPIK